MVVFHPLDALLEGYFINARTVCTVDLQPFETISTNRLTDCQCQETLLHVVTLRVEHRHSVDATTPVHVVRKPDGLELRELVRLVYDKA